MLKTMNMYEDTMINSILILRALTNNIYRETVMLNFGILND